MTYYSALHYAAKAEKSATSAANSARTAQIAAAQSSQASGRIIQLGFDGFMETGRLVFKHSPAGVDIPYDLLDDYEYEIDMAYSGTDLADNIELVVKNGADTINFVSVLHRDSTTPVTVADMKQVMRFDNSTGYRWLFRAAFKVSPSGNKVFLLYPVIANKDVPVIDIPATSDTVTLIDNTVYSGTMTGAMTFVLPAVTDVTKYHQIKAMLYLPKVTINWGTAHYIGGDAPDISEAGQYMIYWDYVPALSAWAVGAMRVV